MPVANNLTAMRAALEAGGVVFVEAGQSAPVGSVGVVLSA